MMTRKDGSSIMPPDRLADIKPASPHWRPTFSNRNHATQGIRHDMTHLLE